MQEETKISIITVCFNSEKTIEDTIQSVLQQSYSNIEYIILDGLSTDRTMDIIKKYEDQISTIRSEKDEGMYDAINKGIQLASGEVIAILNSDDFYINENTIANVMQTFKISKADSVYGDLFYVDSVETDKIKRYWKSGKFKASNFLYGWMPPHPSFFVKKKIYEQNGNFNLSLKSAADYELMLRFLYKNRISTYYLNKVLVKMRVGGMSNVSFKNRLRANKEDKKAWEINKINPKFYTLYIKPIRKVLQFIKKG